jgi:tetratricopeptide (TPR) repeat protein
MNPWSTGQAGLLALLAGACASAPREAPAGRELRATASAAADAFARGELEEAALFFEEARRRARLADDARELGNAAYNLAVCRLEAGDPAGARAALPEAEAALARAGEDLGEVFVLHAKVALGAGDGREAREFAGRLPDGASPALRAEALLVEAEISRQDGDGDAARRGLEAAWALLGEDAAARHAAGIALGARLALAEGRPASAARLFDREAALHGERPRPRLLADALAEAATAWGAAGDDAAAADRFLRAAAVRLALGDRGRAADLVRTAIDSAARARDDLLARRASTLALEIEAQK